VSGIVARAFGYTTEEGLEAWESMPFVLPWNNKRPCPWCVRGGAADGGWFREHIHDIFRGPFQGLLNHQSTVMGYGITL
jgi:hypothetical protein